MAEPIVAAVCLGTQGAAEVGLVFDRGINKPQSAFDFASVDCCDPLPDHLHVFVRHRLLRQPGGFEGGSPIYVVLDAKDATIAGS